MVVVLGSLSGEACTPESIDIQCAGRGGHDVEERLVTTRSDLEDLRGTTEVESLTICDTTSVRDLRALSALRRVRGSLVVAANEDLLDTVGLENLEYVGGVLDIGANPKLERVAPLPRLSHVGATFSVASNPQLTDMPSLGDVSGLGGLFVVRNEALSSGIILPEDPELFADLVVEDNPRLGWVRGLGEWRVAGMISLSGDSLGELPRFSMLERASEVRVSGASIVSIAGFGAVREAGSVIMERTGVDTMEGFSSLESTQQLAVLRNPRLGTLSGLEGMRNVELLYIDGNEALADISALGGITSELRIIRIENNPKLPSCAARALVERLPVEAAAEVVIRNNDEATQCE